MVVTAADAASERRADRHRDGELASGAVPHLGGLGHDLVEGRVDEIHELDFRDRTQAVQGHPDRGADDPAFREGRVEDAVRELVQEALRAPEDAAVPADVFSEDDHAVVPPHLFAQCVVDRLHHRHRRHVHALVAYYSWYASPVGVPPGSRPSMSGSSLSGLRSGSSSSRSRRSGCSSTALAKCSITLDLSPIRAAMRARLKYVLARVGSKPTACSNASSAASRSPAWNRSYPRLFQPCGLSGSASHSRRSTRAASA